MRLLLLLLCTTAALLAPVQAQWRASMLGAAGMPTGYFEDVAENGFGGTITAAYYPFTTDIEFTLSSGVTIFGYKNNLPGYTYALRTVPISAGVRYNFSDVNFIPYLGLEAGVVLNRYVVEFSYRLLDKELVYTNETAAGVFPYAGFRMNLSPRLDLDVCVRYNRVHTPYHARSWILVQSGLAMRITE